LTSFAGCLTWNLMTLVAISAPCRMTSAAPETQLYSPSQVTDSTVLLTGNRQCCSTHR